MSTPPLNKLSVKVDGNQLIFYNPNNEIDDNIGVTFHRTLRIPDDGKIYPLPPSLGSFPVKRVDDYLDRVPEAWKKQGGVFIPLYQREAMWLEFMNFNTEYPHAMKIAVGKVNALSGETWDEEIKLRNVQDYVVTPLQPWLDGINAGDGYIKQFIAMPLGGGYTVEGQVTGEEKVGGCQIICYAPNHEKRLKQFAPKPVVQRSKQCEKKSSYGSDLQSLNLTPSFSIPSSNDCVNSLFVPPSASGSSFGYVMPQEEMCYESAPSSSSCVPSLMDHTILEQELSKCTLDDDECENDFLDYEGTEERKVSGAKELGLAAGGKMKQQIIEDPYGPSFWDEMTKARIFIHIVNSEMYEQITGEKVPPTPITAQTYASYNYPWFDFYNEDTGSVGKSNILSQVKSVKEVDQEKYAWPQQNDSSVQINNVTTIKGSFNKSDVRDGDW
ncbi:hypothetical protein C9374_002772 [Naegleria lovaniensis]|uniref:Integral membrane protein n=1 Tax=Naegleria lovaniensis TaxID=51637 RepID=A0AA88GQ51_NAELO|nr:uncharacterized protein C9374_002772 [Naegleria lovaniensis]KAG2386326.1 hypothetical protein C9374_002772 [Naegleria lovaniensis]